MRSSTRDDRTQVFTALAPHLPPEQRRGAFREALNAAEANLCSFFDGPNTLAKLAPHLPPDLLGEALAAVKGIGDEHTRKVALAALAPHLPPDLLGEALAVAKGISDADSRLKILVALVGSAPDYLKSEALLPLIEIAGRASRVGALSAAQTTAPQTFELGGENAILMLRRAISDVCSWYL